MKLWLDVSHNAMLTKPYSTKNAHAYQELTESTIYVLNVQQFSFTTKQDKDVCLVLVTVCPVSVPNHAIDVLRYISSTLPQRHVSFQTAL